MKGVWGTLCVLALVGCTGGKQRVQVELPLPPRMDLSAFDNLYFAGFVNQDQNQEFDTVRETLNFFRNEFAHRKVIDLLDREPMELKVDDPERFFDKQQSQFAGLDLEAADRTLVLSGVISYNVVDRSGFRTLNTTDFLGQTYQRTQFVEATGYVLKVRIFVYEAGRGDLVYRELLQDEIDIEGPPGDTRLAFYDLLERLSERLVGLFTHTNVKAERTLL